VSDLASVLHNRGLVDDAGLDELRREAAERFDGRLARAAAARLGEDVVRSVLLADACGVPWLRDLGMEVVDGRATGVLARPQAESWGVVPLRYDSAGRLVVAVGPTAMSRFDHTKLNLELQQVPYTLIGTTDKAIRDKVVAVYRNEALVRDLAASVSESGSEATDASVRMVDLLLEQAIADKASDIHVEPADHHVYVRYRIDGVLVDKEPLPLSMRDGIISRLKIMSEIDIAEKRKPQDGRLSVSHAGHKIDMRVATLPTVWGEKVVMRILDNSAARMDLSGFGFSDQTMQRWRAGFSRPYGMILVTGPTGSGKSTTLYATLNAITSLEKNIITVEDPVEYRIERINQVQVNAAAGLTFASALRSILRSDPDVILLGEIRDKETATIAIEAALTGHLVLSTLHTNSAPEAAVRLVEMGVEPFLVASVLECVLAQRLVRRLCTQCRRRVEPDPAELESVQFTLPEGVVPTFYEPVGCPKCTAGYRGRTAVQEAMSRSSGVEHALMNGVSSQDMVAVAVADGMRTMREDGWLKVADGTTTVSEVLRVIA
jgi:type IV pilus assembly protein PilB